MVLATEITMPMTMPCRGGQPRSSPTLSAQPHEERMPSGPPSNATPRTRGEVAQRELDADAEHQQDHPDLGEQLEGVDVGDGGPRGERADQDPPDHVAEDQRLPRQPGHRATEHGGDEPVGRSRKKIGSVVIAGLAGRAGSARERRDTAGAEPL